MDHELTTDVLCTKANCTVKDIKSKGLYTFRCNVTGDSYVGKAQKQSLKNRLIQHLNIAMSNRDLRGNFDPLLRKYPHIDNWMLEILVMEPSRIANAEKLLFRTADQL